MKKRERNLAIATAAVAGVGLLVWITGSPAQPASAAKQDPVVTPPAVSAGTRAPTQDEGAGSVHALTFEHEDVTRLLALLATSSAVLPDIDPFREFEANPAPADPAPTASNPTGQPLPVLGGMYRSGATKGALLDGNVCFEGEQVGPFTLVRVDDYEVTLRYQNQSIVISYDPKVNPTRP
ncbi:MAG: hypothetical protein AB7O52_02185 [Planctomycetota bacterium]